MDVARQGQQLLLGEHGDGLLTHRFGRLFQVQAVPHRDVKHVQPPGCPPGHKGLEHRLRILPQTLRHAYPVQTGFRVVGVGGVGDIILLQNPHYVGFFLFFCH